MYNLLMINTEEAVNSNGTGIISIVIPVILGLGIYFIPTIMAHKKKHLNKTAITLLNIFLGWTFIGWVVSLVWAVTKSNKG